MQPGFLPCIGDNEWYLKTAWGLTNACSLAKIVKAYLDDLDHLHAINKFVSVSETGIGNLYSSGLQLTLTASSMASG